MDELDFFILTRLGGLILLIVAIFLLHKFLFVRFVEKMEWDYDFNYYCAWGKLTMIVPAAYMLIGGLIAPNLLSFLGPLAPSAQMTPFQLGARMLIISLPFLLIYFLWALIQTRSLGASLACFFFMALWANVLGFLSVYAFIIIAAIIFIPIAFGSASEGSGTRCCPRCGSAMSSGSSYCSNCSYNR